MGIDVTEPPGTPTEVLIPEARRHQRGRYVRLGVILAITAVLIAALIASAVILLGGAVGGKTQREASSTALSGSPTTHVYFREVLCTAPPYVATGSAPSTSAPPTCSPGSFLSTKNLGIEPSPNGFISTNVAPDSALASVPSTKRSADRPSATVLLPALRGACYAKGYRCVLGPAEMTESSIRSATATQNRTGNWVVNYTTTTRGAPLWDRVAQENFHLQLAIEVNGVVYSAPFIQPAQSSFSSFDGRGEISGGLTKAAATHLAEAMHPSGRS